MPPIIADSDDDDEIAIDLDTPAVGSGQAATTHTTESTNKQSTGSTDRLRRDMRDAERALLANSSEMAPQTRSSGSPAAGAQKRRHSIVSEKRPSLSPEKRVKRSKTQMTYSKTKQRASAQPFGEEDSFAAFRDDEPAVATSRSARFPGQSAVRSSASARLPDGSVGADFVNHEPNEMFKDSGSTGGSTAVDNESSQQRMIDAALNETRGLRTSAARAVEVAEHKSSSPFPWSAPEQTPSVPKTNRSEQRQSSQVHTGEPELSNEARVSPSEPQVGATEASQTHEQHTEPSQPQVNATHVSELQEQHTEHSQPQVNATDASGPSEHHTAPAIAAEGHIGVLPVTQESQAIALAATLTKPTSSPIVRITVHEPAEPLPLPSVVEPAQKSTKGRRRKTQAEDSEPLNSEDQAVGLPKERYVPRPSRRRATQIAEVPIDYSVPPEKAAKAKRRKTASAASLEAGLDADGGATLRAVSNPVPAPDAGASDPSPAKGVTQTEHETRPHGHDANHGKRRKSENEGELYCYCESADSGHMVACDGKQCKRQWFHFGCVGLPAAPPDDQPWLCRDCQPLQEPEQQRAPSPSPKPQAPSNEQQTEHFPVKDAADEEIFVKPMPKPKAKAAKKTRRSHTTIFEDHVTFDSSQRTPTLSQQQARRQILQTDNEIVGLQTQSRTQKPRRKVVDSDDEDELAIGDNIEPDLVGAGVQELQPEPTSKKRGRGRPPKGAAKAKAKSAEKVLEDSDAESEVVSESEEPPPKKRPGRPPKAAPAVEAVTKPASAGDTPAVSGGAEAEEQTASKENQPAYTPAKQTAISTQGPTPSPEKPAVTAPSGTPQKSKVGGSPVSHSPLKSSSAVPLRVGLSKRQRIAPLLRVMKPPKQR